MAAFALAALRALHTSSDTQERQAANRWLVEFTASSEAFSAARELVLSGDEPAAFFGACTLHIKVAAEWHGMGEAERAAVCNELWKLLAAPDVSPLVGGRLALALAAAAGRSAGGEAQFVGQAIGMLREPRTRLLALRLLGAAADEFDPAASRRLSRDQDEGARTLSAAWPEVWRALAEALAALGRERHASAPGTAALGPESQDAVCLCLSSARALLRWAPLPCRAAGGGSVPQDASSELALLIGAACDWIAGVGGGDVEAVWPRTCLTSRCGIATKSGSQHRS